MTAADVVSAWLIAAVLTPLAIAAAIFVPALRAYAERVAPWAPLPAVLLATGAFDRSSAGSHLVLLGTRLGVPDVMAQTFLMLTAGVWLAASLFARTYMAGDPRRRRFWMYFLLTMTGNLGLVLAQDVASFYCFFAMMTFASYGIIVHTQTREARRAGLVYLVMAVLGEMVLLVALLLIVDGNINLPLADVPRTVAASPHCDLIAVLVLVGFGVKAGVLGLHFWLPLAHPAAPAPASAVLSGALIKAGLLAWLRLLPIGLVELPTVGFVCAAAGIGAAFYGVALGLCQRDPKTILAYSSVSQMGFMTATLGVALAVPEVAIAALAALLFYAMHHAFAKAALFLGAGVAAKVGSARGRRLVLLGVLVPALDLAGAPLSSGALAKLSIKDVVAARPWEWAPLGLLLTIGAIGSTLVIVRFVAALVTARPCAGHAGPGLWLPWLALLVVDVVVVVAPPVDADPGRLITAKHAWSALWPVLAGIAIGAFAWSLRRRLRFRASLPPGDLLVLGERAVHALRPLAAATIARVPRLPRRARPASVGAAIARAVQRGYLHAERWLARFPSIGLLFLVLAVASVVLAWVMSTQR